MKLFTVARGNTEQEKALSREKAFKDEFGELNAQWQQRLISSGMPADQVLSEVPNHEASRYSPEQEAQFAAYARWSHKADPSQFEIGKQDSARNFNIWCRYANGQTEREIADHVGITQQAIHKILKTLQDRCHADIRSGLIDADKDSRSEINDWTRLQAIKQKHLQLLASGSLGSTIVDHVIESGVLERLPLDNDIVEALNCATAQLALALEVEA